MVEEPTQDLNVLIEAIKEKEQKDSKKHEDRENHDDHGNEKEKPTTILFILEQLEVLLKMNKPEFTKLVLALKRGSLKGVGLKLVKPRNFDEI
jgi:hypothetical protein